MTPWIAWLIAAVCAAAFVALWSWEVRRMLIGRQSIVDSAASQVTAFRRRLAQTPADREAAAVLYRSESIYRQAVDNYNHALYRPWVYIPARIMGFRRAPEEPEPGPMDGGSRAE
ncbi:MAG: hypothetical protein EGR26_01600 [Clostridiales bacterium]|nr:hypothetical protein [Clostridiales bacterium]